MRVDYSILEAMIDAIVEDNDLRNLKDLTDYLSTNASGYFVIEEGDSDD